MPPAAGHALIGRALYLPEGCAADEEHRDLAGVPQEVVFATKPRLADGLLDRAQARGIRAAFVDHQLAKQSTSLDAGQVIRFFAPAHGVEENDAAWDGTPGCAGPELRVGAAGPPAQVTRGAGEASGPPAASAATDK
jgi:hypothetical protein